MLFVKWEYEDEDADDYEWEYSEEEEEEEDEEDTGAAKAVKAEDDIPLDEQDLPDPFSTAPLKATTKVNHLSVNLLKLRLKRLLSCYFLILCYDSAIGDTRQMRRLITRCA